MPQKLIDLPGIRFGYLFVDSYVGTRSKHATFRCLCDCGNVVLVSGGNLRSGNTKSCGCKAGELKSSKHKLRKAKSPPDLPPKQKTQAQIKREQKKIRKLHELRKARKGK